MLWRTAKTLMIRVVLIAGAGACSGKDGCCPAPDVHDLIGGNVGDHVDCHQQGLRCLGSDKEPTKILCNCTCSIDTDLGLAENFQGTIDVCLPPDLNRATADPTQLAAIDTMSQGEYDTALQTFCGVRVRESLQVGFAQDHSPLPDAACTCSAAGFNEAEISTTCTNACVGLPCDDNCVPSYNKSTGEINPPACICNQYTRADGSVTEPLCSASPVLTGTLPEMLGSRSTVVLDSTTSVAKGRIFFEDDFGFDHEDNETSQLSGRVILAGRRGPDGNTRLMLEMLLTGTDVEFNFDGIDVAGSLDIPLTRIRVSGETAFNAVVIDSTGSGVIPTGELTIRAESRVGNRHVLATGTNDRPVTVNIDLANQTFDVPLLAVDAGGGVSGSLEIHGTIVNQPPTAVAGADQVVECTTPTGAPVTLDGRISSDPDSDLVRTTWIAGPVAWRGGGVVSHDLLTTLVAPFTPPARTTTYNLMVRDSTFQLDIDPVNVTVRDTVPPTVTLKTMEAFEVCGSGGQELVVKPPALADACSVAVALTGSVVASTNPDLALPVSVRGTQLTVPVGQHTIEWVATDASGNRTVVRQPIDVRPALYARESANVRDRAVLGLPGGPFVPLAASGGQLTQLGVEAHTGDVWSVASVDVRDRAMIGGSIRSAAAITLGQQVSVSGDAHAFVPVPLPPPPALNVAAAPGTADIMIEPGQTRSLPPGSYGAIVVKPRGTLTLGAGSYVFESLDLESDGVLKVAANGTTDIVVRTAVIHRGIVQGRLARFGYSGSAPLFLESPLEARLIAPAAEVTVRRPFSGQLAARRITVDPDVVVTCRAVTGR